MVKPSGNSLAIAGAVLLAGMLAAGCHREPESNPIAYYHRGLHELAKVHRVIFVELAESKAWPGVAEDLSQVLYQEIQAKRMFHITLVPRGAPICNTLNLAGALNGTTGFTMAQLQEMRNAFDCDAILLGEVRNFRPHPHMQVDLELKLLDLKNGHLLWGVNYTWDTTDRNTEKRVKKYFDTQMRDGLEPMDWQLVMISPRAFEKFVAYEVANTLSDGPRLAPVSVQTNDSTKKP
jgi:hypothetical protein